MHIFSFTYTFSWHMHAHLHRHTCLRHARTHTRSNATVVTGFCSSFPLAEFPFPLFSVILLRLLRQAILFKQHFCSLLPQKKKKSRLLRQATSKKYAYAANLRVDKLADFNDGVFFERSTNSSESVNLNSAL